jgi:hypothetical protein
VRVVDREADCFRFLTAQEGDAIDWVLVSTLPVTSPAAGWERIDWYRLRWTIEDYHYCLKTGCRIEQRQLVDQAALERLLAICAPVAVDLLRLQDLARAAPRALAHQHLPAALVAVIASPAQVPQDDVPGSTSYPASFSGLAYYPTTGSASLITSHTDITGSQTFSWWCRQNIDASDFYIWVSGTC